MSRLAVVWATLWLSGCYSTQPYGYEGRDSNATIVVYRQSETNLAFISTLVGVDGKYVARLKQHQYVEIQLAPGPHELRLGANQYAKFEARRLDVSDLQRFYFEAKPNDMNVAAALEPTGVFGASTAFFMHPFLLQERKEDQFHAVVESLERVETAPK
jgi:hypothetical protein